MVCVKKLFLGSVCGEREGGGASSGVWCVDGGGGALRKRERERECGVEGSTPEEEVQNKDRLRDIPPAPAPPPRMRRRRKRYPPSSLLSNELLPQLVPHRGRSSMEGMRSVIDMCFELIHFVSSPTRYRPGRRVLCWDDLLTGG